MKWWRCCCCSFVAKLLAGGGRSEIKRTKEERTKDHCEHRSLLSPLDTHNNKPNSALPLLLFSLTVRFSCACCWLWLWGERRGEERERREREAAKKARRLQISSRRHREQVTASMTGV